MAVMMLPTVWIAAAINLFSIGFCLLVKNVLSNFSQ
jgi:hypothetical protein